MLNLHSLRHAGLPLVLLTTTLLWQNGIAATVPVVNLNDSSSASYGENPNASSTNASSAPTSSLSNVERLAVVERQVANLNQQNSAAKMTDLQNQLQQLQGRVDELAHQNQALADQMKQQYQDLNTRLNAAPPAPAPVAAETETAPSSKPKSHAKSAATSEAAVKAPLTVDANAALTADPEADTVDNSAAESAAYQKGFNLLKKSDYVRAAPAFENFLKAYPKGAHAANAHFWLGEIHLAQNQSDAAATEYRRVISDFPSSDKVQMAQLKLGFAYHDQNDLCKAKSTFEKVIKLYPKSTAASLAKKALVDIPSPCSAASRASKNKA